MSARIRAEVGVMEPAYRPAILASMMCAAIGLASRIAKTEQGQGCLAVSLLRT